MSSKSSIKEVDINLSPVDYTPLLREILATVKKRADLFSVDTDSLEEIAIDAVAMEVVQKLVRAQFKGCVPFNPSKNLTFSTAIFEDGAKL